MRDLTENQANKTAIISENFKAVENAQIFGYRVQGTSGLIFAYWGGSIMNNLGNWILLANGSITLTASSSNLIYYNPNNNTVEKVIGANFTRQLIGEKSIPIAKIETDATKILNYQDARNYQLGNIGTNTSGTPQTFDYTQITANVSLNFINLGKLLIHNATDTTARTITIPNNSSVALPIGSVMSIINELGAGVLTITTGDTLIQAGSGALGARTIDPNGIATITKIGATTWIISGVGVV